MCPFIVSAENGSVRQSTMFTLRRGGGDGSYLAESRSFSPVRAVLAQPFRPGPALVLQPLAVGRARLRGRPPFRRGHHRCAGHQPVERARVQHADVPPKRRRHRISVRTRCRRVTLSFVCVRLRRPISGALPSELSHTPWRKIIILLKYIRRRRAA